MKIPTLSIVTIALLGWGIFINYIGLSIGLLLVIFSHRIVDWRWQIQESQFQRLGDLVVISILMIIVYGQINTTQIRLVFLILQFLPLFFFPLLLAQYFSQQEKIPVSSLFYSFRGRKGSSAHVFDFNYGFSCLCVLSASVTNAYSEWYFIWISCFLFLLLLNQRSQTVSFTRWGGLLFVICILAYAAQTQVRSSQLYIQDQLLEWFSSWHIDPFKTRTSIGDIGQLKLSDQILFRVKSDSPLLLHQASYDRYIGQSWYASKLSFLNWKNQPIPKTDKTVELTIFQSTQRKNILALPYGSLYIKGLQGATLSKTELGTVKLTDVPKFISYQVFYNLFESGFVSQYDLDVPEFHKTWIKSLKLKLGMNSFSAQEQAKGIRKYFQDNYLYSVDLGLETNVDKAIHDFIVHRKNGHCELFAVASVFLLRSYGIPARLAHGYTVQEFDDKNQYFVVRKRHAHAWALAWIDNHWQPVDSTPVEWLELENQQVSFIQPLSDWFSDLWFKIKQWQYLKSLDEGNDIHFVWILLAFFCLLCYWVWRLIQAERVKKTSIQGALKKFNKNQRAGLDSDFYRLEQLLQNQYGVRGENQTIKQWIGIQDSQHLLHHIINLHYRYRFDPKGVNQDDRDQLRQSVKQYLTENS